jgi:hypothetical protein
MTRQALLAPGGTLELWAILDEAALRRLVGGARVMRDQLDQLAERSRSSRVTVQVIPLEAGAHPGMDSAFAVLQLETVSDVVYVEGLMGYFFLQNQGDVVRYRRAFEQLRAVALSPSDSRDRMRSVAATLPA